MYSGVKRRISEFGEVYRRERRSISARAAKAANIEQKINRPPLKEHSAVCLVLAGVQIGEGQNFQRALIAMLQK